MRHLIKGHRFTKFGTGFPRDMKANDYKFNEFMSQLNVCDDYTLLKVWAEYVQESDNYDDEIFDMDSIDEVLENYKTTDILRMVKYGDFDICQICNLT